MSKARDIRLYKETMEKLDTISCQLHSLSNTVRKQSAAKLVRGPSITAGWVDEVATWTTDPMPKSPVSWWEQQCREKDATLTETLRKLQAAEDELINIYKRIDDNTTYMGVQIDCEATRAALDAIIKDFLSRPKAKA